MKTRFAAIGLALMLAVSPCPADEGKGGGFGERLEKELQLDDAQKGKVREIRSRHREKLRSLKKTMSQLKAELLAAMQAPAKGPEYRKELSAKFDRLLTLRRELQQKRFEKALDIRDVLTESQIRKFGELQTTLKDDADWKSHGGAKTGN